MRVTIRTKCGLVMTSRMVASCIGISVLCVALPFFCEKSVPVSPHCYTVCQRSCQVSGTFFSSGSSHTDGQITASGRASSRLSWLSTCCSFLLCGDEYLARCHVLWYAVNIPERFVIETQERQPPKLMIDVSLHSLRPILADERLIARLARVWEWETHTTLPTPAQLTERMRDHHCARGIWEQLTAEERSCLYRALGSSAQAQSR